MHSHWYNLIAKEWHANKWKLASLAAILLVTHTWILVDATVAGFDAFGDPSGAFELLVMTSFFCAVPGALFVGMGVAAGERSAGTFAFMRALPVPPWKVAAAKLLMASVTVVAPVALTVLLDGVWLALAMLAGRLAETEAGDLGACAPFAEIGQAGLIASGLAVSIMLWSAVAGARQPSELRAGIAAVGVFAIWAVATFVLAIVAKDFFSDHDGIYDGIYGTCLAVWYVGPAGLTALLNHDPAFSHWSVVISLQLISLCCLCAWFLYRYAHAGIDMVRSPAKASTRSGARRTGLNPPRRGPLAAIGWKQWRESLPICIGGLLPACAIAVIIAVIGGIQILTASVLPSIAQLSAQLLMIAAIVAFFSVFFGVVVALVVGIGTFVAELQPDLLTFWRSRPISPTLWFWTKYVTGALAILLFLDGPTVVVALVAVACGTLGGWASVTDPYVLAFLGCAPLLHLLAFSSAVCLICVVREAVYAGILTVGLLLVAFLTPQLVPSLEWLGVTHVTDGLEHMPAGIGLVELARVLVPFIGAMLGLSTVATLLAWQAVVRDVSIKP
jgi:ABC-type transport system involved in multi-copper enzyme maturation permease subunit